jgi:Tfp pilus assembly protein PilV
VVGLGYSSGQFSNALSTAGPYTQEVALLTRHVLPRHLFARHARRDDSCGGANASLKQMFRVVTVASMMAGVLALSACSTTKSARTTDDSSDPQAISTLEEHLARAARAEGAGDKEKAREFYRQASRAYPVAEEPWRKLAESYFNVGDYGNAILASQEVMQRNPKDAVAASVLAISGLRLSTQALGVLRDQADTQRARAGGLKPLTKSTIIVAARLEAETLARNLREVLGEPVLVPNDAPAAGQSAGGNRPRPRPAATPNAAPPAQSGGANPFDKLK